ncbi:MAG TPA: adenylate/guanylate cyclase domain-containing protein [Gemmataceae bacterium]|nr:adenylate/guanylate cyclase domain-containing protein [Gemmataceae bacterium]
MSPPYQIRVYENQQLLHTFDCDGAAEVGRQAEGEHGPFRQKREAGRSRLIIAHLNEPSLSRKHVLIEPLTDGRFRVTNLSSTQALYSLEGGELKHHNCRELAAPVVLTLGKKTLRIQPATPSSEGLQALAEAVTPPGSSILPRSSLFPLSQPAGDQPTTQGFVRWLRSALDVLQSAASSSDFFERAAQAVVQMVGLDSGRVLLLIQGEWQTQATRTAHLVSAESSWRPSQHVLGCVCKEKRTFWEMPTAAATPAASLIGVKAVVAAPILSRDGIVIGALYGERRRDSAFLNDKPITELEAMLVELLAGGVAAGLARLEQEQAALAARIQFQQFFTPELSRQLEARPDLLKGRDTEVTMLFCDIRGFSRVSEQLGPEGTVEWLGAVLGALSDCVRAHAGVLMDYIGDELIAMWGAPEAQPEHARLACRAALDMLAALPALNRSWEPILKEPMNLGIGINTGIAQVGNTGTRHKFKYGALGNTVNLASRVQGATRHLKTRLLITGATHARLGPGFEARRLCRARVVNIHEPVDLYELPPPDHPCWADAKREYETGLEAFEKRNFHEAARILANLRGQCPEDGPALLLLSRAVNGMVQEPVPIDLVWELPGK